MPQPRFAASYVILFSAICTIALGTLLLMLPFAHTEPISFLDTLFVCVSSVTGTGLLTVPISHFTPIGLTIILIIAQIGSLGLILMTVALLYLFFNIGKDEQLLTAELMNIHKTSNLKKIILFVVGFTFLIELIGGLLVAIGMQNLGWEKAIPYGLFHSISAFTSVGISLFPENLDPYSHNPFVLIPLIILMLAGGIGFITLRSFMKYITNIGHHRKYHFSLNTKIVWITTLILAIIAITVYLVLEHNHALAAYNPAIIFLNAIFNGISSMGTGFDTVNVNLLRLPTLLMIMIIAFIGSSPGSTGSGIRTTTVAIFFSSISAVIWGRPYVQMFGKRIAQEQVYKATAILALSVPWIIFATFIMLILEPEYSFLQILFESMSAFSTLGISTGITPYLSSTSKLFLILNMFLGRIGPFTLIFAIKKAIRSEKENVPEERILLG